LARVAEIGKHVTTHWLDQTSSAELPPAVEARIQMLEERALKS
jgi:hypothetical protein